MPRLALLILLVVALPFAPTSVHAAVAVVSGQDPTLVVCAAATCDVTFASLPTSGNTMLVLYRARFTHTTVGAFPTVSAGQGCTFSRYTVQAPLAVARQLTQFNSDTGANAGVVGAAYCQDVGSVSGTYKITVAHADIHHIAVKAYELSGLSTGDPSATFLIRYLLGFTVASSTSMTANVTTTTNAAVFIVCGPVDPTGLTHLNTGGGWTRCTGCPNTDATNGAPVDIVYKLNTTAATYTDDWTLTNASRSSCTAFSLKAP